MRIDAPLIQGNCVQRFALGIKPTAKTPLCASPDAMGARDVSVSATFTFLTKGAPGFRPAPE